MALLIEKVAAFMVQKDRVWIGGSIGSFFSENGIGQTTMVPKLQDMDV